MRFAVSPLLVALLCFPLVTACGPKKKKKQVRAEKGIAKLDEVMTARRQRLTGKMPDGDTFKNGNHPWLEWINKVSGSTPRSEFQKVAIIARGSKVRVEIGVDGGAEVAANLKNLGYEVQEREGENSGIHLIQVTKDGLVGAADMRREGTVRAWKAQ